MTTSALAPCRPIGTARRKAQPLVASLKAR